MPFQIILDTLPAGYAASAALPGEAVRVAVAGFTTSEDGDVFIERLEGLPAHLVGQLPVESNVRPSTIDHLLAIIQADRSATVFVNELRIIGQMRAKRSIKAGEPIRQDDVADIADISFDGVDIPPSAGVLFLFSMGWRKGLFYDFAPLHSEAPRQFDLKVVLAQAYTYLTFQHLFKITGEEWSALLGQGWFPFQMLRTDTIKEMLAHVRNQWPVDRLLDRIADETRESLDKLTERIASNPMFADEIPFIDLAFKHFRQSDYISSISVLYPRLEGIMRRQHFHTQPHVKPSQGNLATGLVEADAKSRHALSLLLPDRFREFLASVYFKDFDPQQPQGISRHTVSHGVAPRGRL